MSLTLTQKILSARVGRQLKADELILVDIDLILGNDITSPVAITEFNKLGTKTVFDPSKIAIVLDHFTPNKDINSAKQCQVCRDFSNKHDIQHFYDVGKMGVEHALLPEIGLTLPHQIIIGADSHTCTYGALGVFSTGVGSTDMAYAMATGKAWFKVPRAIRINLSGKLSQFVSGKDIILHLIGLLGVDGARYMSLEFMGDGVSSLTIDDRFTICNMAIECGAKNGIFPVDDIAREYLAPLSDKKFETILADVDAEYEQTITIDLNKLKPTISFPSLPSNTFTLPYSQKIKIDQVVIGSCTNGRLSDIAKAVAILGSHTIAKGIRLIVIPATQKIYIQCIKLGYVEKIINFGGVFSTPTCGPCLGGHSGILAPNEVCVSTTNRNFVGRMGDITSSVYLASPQVAAASAILGYLACPTELRGNI